MSDMLGRVFALSTDEEQAQFLNSVGKTLNRTCENGVAFEYQCCLITNRLDLYGKKFIKKIAEFIEHDEQVIRDR